MGGVILVLVALMLLFSSEHVKGEWVQIASADFIFAYFPYFLAGIFVMRYKEQFLWLLDNQWASLLIFLFAILPVIRAMPYYATDFCRLMQVVALFSIFRHASGFFESSNIIAKGLRLIGRNTLEIYFLQYFLLFRIDFIGNLLLPLTSDYCFRGNSCYALIEILLVGVITVFICLACIAIRKMLKPFPIITKLCFGK